MPNELRALATTVAVTLSCVASAAAQTARVEIDHVFVYAPRGAVAEAEALRKLGFFVDTVAAKHTGQGTASLGIIFDNAYFEMIWIDSTVSVNADLRSMHEQMRRSSSWQTTGASPFGVGLRKVGGGDAVGIPVTRMSGEWMRPGSFIALLRQPSEPDALDMFIVPEYMALPVWVATVRQHAPEVLSHPNGARRVTGIEIRAPRAQHPHAADVLKVDSFRSVQAAAPLLIVELDGATRGEIMDLRPLLPVLFRR
jgi:hypothetical protein